MRKLGRAVSVIGWRWPVVVGGGGLWVALAFQVWAGFAQPSLPEAPRAHVTVFGADLAVLEASVEIGETRSAVEIRNSGDQAVTVEVAALSHPAPSVSRYFLVDGNERRRGVARGGECVEPCLTTVGSGGRLRVSFVVEASDKAGARLAIALPRVALSQEPGAYESLEAIHGDMAVVIRDNRERWPDDEVVRIERLEEVGLNLAQVSGPDQASQLVNLTTPADLERGIGMLFEDEALARRLNFMTWLAAVLFGAVGPHWVVFVARTIRK